MDTSLCTPEAVATRVDAAICKCLFKVLQLHVSPAEHTHLQKADIEFVDAACAHFGNPEDALDDIM